MNLSLGIVGLPNVGKSTLFNALTKGDIAANNYPFCTIDPNTGIAEVKDDRLYKLAKIEKSQNVIPAVVKFVDIAGLVRGAAEGEGLGNQFLSHIKEVNAIIHLIRNFEDSNIPHVDETIEPKRDKGTIELELILKDIDSLENKISKIQRDAKFDKKLARMLEFTKELLEHLQNEKTANSFETDPNDEELNKYRKELFLLTDKPFLYVVNTKFEDISSDSEKLIREKLNLKDEDNLIQIDIKLEEEISKLDDEEKQEFLEELGIDERPLENLIRKSYEILDLISFFTAGEKEARAWTIKKGSSAPQAAGAIHTDFETKFIAADVVYWEDFVKNNGWVGSKDVGKVRLEGRDYEVKDGDVIVFKHGA